MFKLKNSSGIPVPCGKRIFAPAREYHRRHDWNLNRDGIMVRHSYENMTAESLSWWDDMGLIFAKRRIMVWWQHPRMVYEDRLEEMAIQQCALPKEENWLMRSEPIRKKAQRGCRMKTVGYRMLSISEEYRQYYDLLQATQAALSRQDHGWVIMPSIRSRALDWCQGVDLVAPVEIRCKDDFRLLQEIVKRHLQGDKNTLAAIAGYTFADWRKDQKI